MSSEAWFPSYGLLMIKENAQSVRLELQHGYCKRQTSGTQFSSAASKWGCLPRLPTKHPSKAAVL